MKDDITQFYTPDQLKEIMAFLKLNEHNLGDLRSLEMELLDRFEYILDSDHIPLLVDYYYNNINPNIK